MQGILIFIFSVLLIGICFLVAMKSNKSAGPVSKKNGNVPEAIQVEFRKFVEDLLVFEEIFLEECKITETESVAEVPYEQGVFKYLIAEYNLTPTTPIVNAHGLVLNSKEILAKAGFRDELMIICYEENEEIFEVSFIPAKRVGMQGYKAYIETRYRNLKEWPIIDEYSFMINDVKLTLWGNLKGEKPLEEASLERIRAKEHFAQSAQYVDNFEAEDMDVSSWVQFERKKELIFYMRAKSYKVKTPRGIGVGDTVEQLKEKYPMGLSYTAEFDELGAAYGYIPEDGTNRYISFRTENGIITEMIAADAFGDRPFVPKDGYVDQDVPWLEVDYSSKMTEKYARAIYLGQHKADMDPRQVFNNFVTNTFDNEGIIDKGVWREGSNEQLCFVIYKNPKEEERVYVEVALNHITVKTFTSQSEIWVVTKFRSQKKRG